MDRAQLYECRDQNYRSVRDLAVTFHAFPVSRLSDKDLDWLGVKVKVTRMGLLDGVPRDGGPQFFKPFPPDRLERFMRNLRTTIYWPRFRSAYDYYAALEISDVIDECVRTPFSERTLGYYSAWRKRCIGSSYFETLYCTDRDSEHWQVQGIHDMYTTSTPHLACTLVQKGPLVEDQLLRSELLCLTYLMAGRLRDHHYQFHRYVPVMVYSFAGRKARVIAAHYEHPEFIVRKSEITEFEEKDDEKVKLMLRWRMMSATGDTAYRLLPEPLISYTVRAPQNVPSVPKRT